MATRKKNEESKESKESEGKEYIPYEGAKLTKEQQEALCGEDFKSYLAEEMEKKSHEMSTMAGAGQYLDFAEFVIGLLKRYFGDKGLV